MTKRPHSFFPLFKVLIFIVLTQLASADIKSLRWTEAEDKNADFEHVVSVIKEKTAYNVASTDFTKIEDRKLATSQYLMYAQMVSGSPIQGATIRIWKTLDTNEVIQVEATVEDPAPIRQIALNLANRPPLALLGNFKDIEKLVKAEVNTHDDNGPFQIVKSTKLWKNKELVQEVKVKTRRGYHVVSVSLEKAKVIEHTYKAFPQNDITLQAKLYPIYEEAEGQPGELLERVPLELKYIKSHIRKSPTNDPFAALKTQHYSSQMFDPIRGLTEAGREQGFWAMSYIKQKASEIRESFPLVENNFENGLVLEGRYATINIHPSAATQFTGINFPLVSSAQFRPDWQFNPNTGWEMIPGSTLLGKAIHSQNEVLERPARRLADHDPVSYMNDGFDELQVYYSVNALMESLQSMGFSDEELSTRPFHAFLYDADISMRDNAYYTDDTINFTTYSPKAQNYARDNSTIWHELGHGIMDRLMGDSIVLADTGGLSEGMADFLAALVIADLTMDGPAYPGMNDYRIINKTGFNLTNEVHDDGEAYGGAMDDMKKAAIAREGRLGLKKMTDLTLETMRLTRNNPGLTAAGWFEHMLFADSRGSAIRNKGEMKAVIMESLIGRNFSLNEATKLADFSLKNGNQEVLAGTPGARENPIRVNIAQNQSKSFNLNVKIEDGENYKFNYPVQVKVFFTTGALQGAIDWENEDSEPKVLTITESGQSVPLTLKVSGRCDEVNREDGSCVDYAYVQIWNNDQATKPVAKKRFYLRIKNP